MRTTRSLNDIYIYLINQARGPYWENIGPRSWQYGPSAARSVQKRPRVDILPVRSRASLVNKRFITRLKKALKVFHKFHVTLCGKCYLARTRCFHRWSWFTIIRLAFENFLFKAETGFLKVTIHSGVLRRNFRKISSSSAILISSSKGHKCGIIRDNARSNTWRILDRE